MSEERLREVRASLTEVVEMARRDDSIHMAWLLLGAQTAALDLILSELIGDARDPVPGV